MGWGAGPPPRLAACMGSGQDPAAPEVSRMAARVWLWGHQGVRMTVVKAAADLTELPYWCGHRATVLSGEAATRGSGEIGRAHV